MVFVTVQALLSVRRIAAGGRAARAVRAPSPAAVVVPPEKISGGACAVHGVLARSPLNGDFFETTLKQKEFWKTHGEGECHVLCWHRDLGLEPKEVEGMPRRHFFEEKDRPMTVGDILRAMESSAWPGFVTRAAEQVQQWMMGELAAEEAFYEEANPAEGADPRTLGDTENLFLQLAWLEEGIDLLPTQNGGPGRGCSEALVLAIGPIDIDEGLRIAVDHVALFARGKCHRVWVFCDNWIVGDALRYLPHIRTLAEQGVDLRFVLLSPWGWTEIPLGRNPDKKGPLPWRSAEEGLGGPSSRLSKEGRNRNTPHGAGDEPGGSSGKLH